METRTSFFSEPLNFHCLNYSTFFFFLFFQLLLAIPLLGQSNLPCYSIAKLGDQSDQLHEYNSVDNLWKNLGHTGTLDIESIAVDYENSIIYAVNKGIFGSINPTTAMFTEIKTLGNVDGAFGIVMVNDICAITYDEDNQVVYAVHRNGLNNGILIKIDPQTGDIYTNAFEDDNENIVDYAVIEGIFFGSPQTNYIIDIADIAYDSKTNLLYAMYYNNNVRIVAKINALNGDVESQTNLIYKEIAGIGFDSNGNLKATTLSNESLNDFSSLFTINISESSAELVGVISNDFENNFICIDCAKKIQEIKNCDIEINITDYSPQIATINALQTINSNANVTAQTEYKAVDYINLSLYFEVDANTNFSALIENTCE